jgi:glycosyltransferase involved in cell wall biosynthesis
MSFWLKNLIYVIILVVLAFYLWINRAEFFSFNTSAASVEEISPPVEATKSPIEKSQSNPAAEGLSKFYANLRGDMNGDGPRVRNNIVYLPDPKGDIVELLEARRLVIGPLRKSWRGSTENRPFRTGETLHQKLVEYANIEGIEVIWWLNRDFIVKDPFRIDKSLIDTAYGVGKAVAGHFQDGLYVYFCYQQRNIVLINRPLSYLTEECLLLPKKNSRR